MVNNIVSTPLQLSTPQLAVLCPNSADSTLMKKAKEHLQGANFAATPKKSWSCEITTVNKGKTKRALSFVSPQKNQNAIYRWKVEVLEGDEVLVKRLIGKSSLVKKRLSSYFTAIRAGQTTLAKMVIKSLTQSLHNKGLRVSFGVIHSNVPPELLGRVEKLLIDVHKVQKPEAVLNQRSGGGGASQRKPLSLNDVTLVHDIASKILAQKSDMQEKNSVSGTFKLQKKRVIAKLKLAESQKKGVVYSIENLMTGKMYVGKTEAFLRRRFSQHTSAVNTLKRAKRVHLDIKKNPENFVIKVLYQAPRSQVHILEEVEHAYILALGSHKKRLGYNDNKGSSLIRNMTYSVENISSPEFIEQIKKVQAVFSQLEHS